jgi:hypothetical protein
MADDFEYVSKARLVYKSGARHAYLGDVLHYELAVPPDALEATERGLAAHPRGCPAHESVKGARSR